MIQFTEIYEVADYVKDNMTAATLADYLWFNYPKYADDLRAEIEARLYLSAMEMQPNEFD